MEFVFDLNLSFVKAVLEASKDPSKIDIAVNILEESEHKFGASIWKEPENSIFPAGSYRLRDGIKLPKLNDIFQLISNYQSFNESYEPEYDDEIFNFDGDIFDQKYLVPLISSTNCIAIRPDFTANYFALYENGAIIGWTYRSWCQFLSKWARQTGWNSLYNNKWDYIDFFNLNSDEYQDWNYTIMEIIEIKTNKWRIGSSSKLS